MELTDQEWAAIGRAVQSQRRRQFKGKKAAYTQAELNSGTWDRLEAGLSVKESSLIAAVQVLWPEAGGDWTRIPGVGAPAQDASYVASPGKRVDGGPEDEVLSEIRAMREEQRDMSERLARVEERLADS